MIKKILKKHGFKQSTLPNELTKDKRYKAVIWKGGKVTISRYSPNYGRYLDSETYSSKSSLEKELNKNHT